jgi:DNA-binding transcriptional LysR family regulator
MPLSPGSACTVRLGAHNAATIEARVRGEIDLMVTHLPVDDAELVVGPIVDREERLVALAHDHPLADRAAVSLDDIANYDVGWPDLLLPQVSEAFVPSLAPSGQLAQ